MPKEQKTKPILCLLLQPKLDALVEEHVKANYSNPSDQDIAIAKHLANKVCNVVIQEFQEEFPNKA